MNAQRVRGLAQTNRFGLASPLPCNGHEPKLHKALRCMVVAVAMAWPIAQAAETAPTPSSPQERLEAIRLGLIEATLQTPTVVRGMSWIDSRGGLHELSVFKNSLNVQSVQVKGYERSSEGSVKALLDIQSQDATPPGCGQGVAAEKWRHPVHFYFQPDPRLHPAATTWLAGAVQQEWLDTSTSEQSWQMVPDLSKPAIGNTMTTYERVLLGHPGGQQPWQASLKASSRLVQIPRRSNWLLSDPWIQLRLNLRLIPTDREDAAREISTELRLPLVTTDWAPATLGGDGETLIRRQLQAWRQTLNDWLRCEPMQARVLKAQGAHVTVSLGRLAGVKSGDEWLIADPSQLPKQLVDPQGLQQTLLARANVVGVNTTQLVVVAGSMTAATPSSVAQWRAWPVDGLMGDAGLKASLTQAQVANRRSAAPHP